MDLLDVIPSSKGYEDDDDNKRIGIGDIVRFRLVIAVPGIVVKEGEGENNWDIVLLNDTTQRFNGPTLRSFPAKQLQRLREKP